MATPIPKNAAEVTARSAAAATGGVVVRGTDAKARGIVADTRAITGGEAFVALRGERHDGHAFVSEAVARGATLVVVDRDVAVSGDVAVVRVGDTLRAWGDLARAHIRAWRRARPDGLVVAITGSAGKTTTKQLCTALLGEVGPTHASAGNLNNLVGVPAVVFGLTASHRFAVLECGMSVRGEIAALASIASADVAVITNVSVAHAEGVGGTLADVAREKGALFDALGPEGACVFDTGDAACVELAERCRARKVGFGLGAGASYRLANRVAHGLDGSRVTLAGSRELSVELPFAGEAAALDLCGALAAAEACAGPIADEAIARALSNVRNVEGRATIHKRADGLLIIDDSYNANPASMRAACATLTDVTGRRRVAVLGEMKELGPAADNEHLALASALASAKVDLLVGCGGLMRLTVGRARELGIDAVDCGSVEEATRVATERVRANDVVLVKGSRSVGTEAVVAALRGSA